MTPEAATAPPAETTARRRGLARRRAEASRRQFELVGKGGIETSIPCRKDHGCDPDLGSGNLPGPVTALTRDCRPSAPLRVAARAT